MSKDEARLGLPFDKLNETAWNIQGQKLLLNSIQSMMKQWESDAHIDLAQFVE